MWLVRLMEILLQPFFTVKEWLRTLKMNHEGIAKAHAKHLWLKGKVKSLADRYY